jgi:hypothetical protein
MRQKKLADLVVLLGCALLAVSSGWAQTAAPSNASAGPSKVIFAPQVEIGGLVTCQVLTQYGQQFHARFTQAWNARTDVDGYQLLVKERLLPRGGTDVLIFSGDNVVFRTAIPRNALQIASLIENAVEQAYQNAVEQGLQALLFRDSDQSVSGL